MSSRHPRPLLAAVTVIAGLALVGGALSSRAGASGADGAVAADGAGGTARTDGMDGAGEGGAGDSPFQNVELLTHVSSKSEMRAIMKEQSRALGVKCVHCHVPGKFHLDEKEAKATGLEMMRMVRELNATWFPDHEEPVVTCWTCHRGTLEPEATRPDGAEAPSDGFEALDE